MSNPNSPTLEEVVGNIVKEVLREEAEKENRETAPAEEVREEVEETDIEVEVGQARAFYSKKGADTFKKYLTKKGFVEERGFKNLVSPFKEEVKKRGWETVSQHMELGRRALMKEFSVNLGERKTLTCYFKGRWVPFGEGTIS